MDFRALRVAAATFTIMAGTLLPATSSHALGGFVGYLGLDVEAGLDSATRNFLQGYPKEIREQAVIGATQIMNRADESIAKVFIQGRDILLLGKDVIVCTGVTVENIPRGMLERLFGIRPNYTEVLQNELKKLGDEAKLTSKPGQLYTRYVDVDNIGSDAYCLTLQDDLDQHSVMKIRAEVKTTGLLWKRMEALAPSPTNQAGCSTVRDCYVLVSTTVDTDLATAPKQDKDLIKADERMGRVVRPPEPKETWFSNNFDLRTYEQAMLIMLAVHDDLLRVAAKRQVQGLEAYKKLKDMVAGTEALVAEAERQKGAAACNRAYNMAPQVRAAQTQLDAVKAYEIVLPAELLEVANRLQGVESRRVKLASTSSVWIYNDGKSCSVVPREPPPGLKEPV
ncbi:hypothetical protein ACRCPS_17500 [Pseudomonas aeruginosa]